MFRIAERLLELLKPITSGADQEGDYVDEHVVADDDDDAAAVDDHDQERARLLRWLKIDRFDRRAANRDLAQVARMVVA